MTGDLANGSVWPTRWWFWPGPATCCTPSSHAGCTAATPTACVTRRGRHWSPTAVGPARGRGHDRGTVRRPPPGPGRLVAIGHGQRRISRRARPGAAPLPIDEQAQVVDPFVPELADLGVRRSASRGPSSGPAGPPPPRRREQRRHDQRFLAFSTYCGAVTSTGSCPIWKAPRSRPRSGRWPNRCAPKGTV